MAEANGSYTFRAPVRAAFCDSLVSPKKVGKKGAEKGEPVYSLTALIAPDSPDVQGLKAAMAAVAKETWPGRDLKELKFPLESGDKRAKDLVAAGKDGELFKGSLVLSARSGMERPPALAILTSKGIEELLGAQRDVVGKQKFYNGCYVVPSVWLKAYRKGSEGGIGEFSGVKAYISSVLWVKDGERIGGASATETFRAYAGSVSNVDPGDDETPF